MHVRAAAVALEVLLPSACPACGEPLPGTAAVLCAACWSRVLPVAGVRCPRCAGPGDEAAAPCLGCRESPPPQAATVTWGEYDGGLREAVLALKHRGRDELARPLARRLAGRVAVETWVAEVTAVVPVPSHPWRRVVRGIPAAELLAREVARSLQRPLRRCLRRRGLARQVTRSRTERLRLPRGAFTARRQRGAVLLVDDVMTTGATLARAAAALLERGAGPIYAAVLAATPHGRRTV